MYTNTVKIKCNNMVSLWMEDRVETNRGEDNKLFVK